MNLSSDKYSFDGPYRSHEGITQAWEVFAALDICEQVDYLRKVISQGLKIRVGKLRQPLSKATIITKNPYVLIFWIDAILQEWNVKFIRIIDMRCLSDKETEDHIVFDTILTEELKEEGWYAELKRAFQNHRKNLKMSMEEKPAANFFCDKEVFKKNLIDFCKCVNVVYDSTLPFEDKLLVDNTALLFTMRRGDDVKNSNSTN